MKGLELTDITENPFLPLFSPDHNMYCLRSLSFPRLKDKTSVMQYKGKEIIFKDQIKREKPKKKI